MSQEHPHSTPRRGFPKPVLSAFGSTGLLQRKNRGYFEKYIGSSNTPETPLKVERSKFVIPPNLSPFALSPKILSSDIGTTPVRGTNLRDEILMESDCDTRFFEEKLLHSPCHYPVDAMEEESSGEIVTEDIFNESFNSFVEKSFLDTTDFDMDCYSITPSADDEEEIVNSSFSCHTETWKSSKVSFLNEWDQTQDFVHYEKFTANLNYADFFAENFEILELVGCGSFSTVYKVRSKHDNFTFALKKTKWPFKGSSDRLTRLREVRNLWRARNCPNCVRIEFAWEQFGHLYILTEFCGRGSLKTLINHLAEVNERFTERSIWDILGQCANALKFLHTHDIIHLDLKPENIFLNDEGVLKIGDFGLSTIVDNPPSLHSEGDKYYMAPEVLNGTYSKAADIFSLGLILLELAADVELPPSGDSWQNLRHGDFSELSLDDTSDMLNALIKEMTYPNPEFRPSIEKVLWRSQFFFEKNRLQQSTLAVSHQ